MIDLLWFRLDRFRVLYHDFKSAGKNMAGTQDKLDPKSGSFVVNVLVSAGRLTSIVGPIRSSGLYLNQRCYGRGLREADATNKILCFEYKMILHNII